LHQCDPDGLTAAVRARPSHFVSLATMIVVVVACALPLARPSGAAPDTEDGAETIELLPLQTTDRRIVDTAGRDVLLRGANVNSFGEYWQGVPSIPATIPVTDADWDLMASRGFSVVRLLITWSRVEPTRGSIDQGYLDEVEAAVDAAASRGIYTVIDMHQDAYTATLFTSDPASCAPGTSPAKGWDGAPAWATLTDGLSTCLTNGERNSSPAVQRAWNNFYDNTDGIRDRFVAAWAAVATRFAGRAEVAGYDVLNEPEVSRPAAEMQAVYDDFLADTILAIRAAEAGAAFDHIVFVEPAIATANPDFGLVVIPSASALGGDVSNVSAAVHNYMESITNQLTIEQMNDFIEAITTGLGVPNWGGEYGFWDVEPDTLATARRYAADEDAHLWGGAWWQWRQSCGDPHAVRWSGGQVVSGSGTSTHLNLLSCPGNVDLGPNDAFLDIVGRGYPRAAPGRLVEVRSDSQTGLMSITATAIAAGGELVVWTPTDCGPDHLVSVVGLTDVEQRAVEGGRIITATVANPGTYQMWVGAADDDLAQTMPCPEPASSSPTTTPDDASNAPDPTPTSTIAVQTNTVALVGTAPSFTG
jgi:endoglycosylceramidase